jgi:SNF2 family DNA or RNA helicase
MADLLCPVAESLRDPQPKSITEVLRVWEHGAVVGSGSALGPLLADSMGTGKTATAIIAANTFGMRRVLVICPKAAIGDWVRELHRWHTRLRNLIVLRAGQRWVSFQSGWVLLNYDLLDRYPEIGETGWDLVICDEGQYLKEPLSKRTAMVFGGEWQGRTIPPISTRHALVISGTPCKNRIEELFTSLNFLDASNWPERDTFIDDHYEPINQHGQPRIVTYTGRVVQSAETRNLDLLHRKLKATVLVRTHKGDLKGLPPKVFESVLVPQFDDTTANWLERRQIAQRFAGIALKDARKSGNVEEVRYWEDMVKRFDSIIKQETARNKAAALLGYLLTRKEKVVVIVFHLDLIEQLEKALRKAGRKLVAHTGRHGSSVTAVTRFQSDPECQFFVGQINVSNLSLTLTSSAHVVFAEIPDSRHSPRRAQLPYVRGRRCVGMAESVGMVESRSTGCIRTYHRGQP